MKVKPMGYTTNSNKSSLSKLSMESTKSVASNSKKRAGQVE